MCYNNCQYERYPWGPNEGCVCRKPSSVTCPLEEEDEDKVWHDEDDEEE